MGKRSGTAANAAAVALLGVAVYAIPLLAGTANAVPFTFETVALSGDVAPGTDGATFTTRFRQPVLNASGNTAFYAELADAGLANQGIWKEGASLDLVVRRGDAAPGAAGTTFSRFSSSPAINDSGNTAFTARIAGATVTSSDDTGIWKEGASIDLAVREGDVAPGTGGATFQNIEQFSFNDFGNTAFRGVLTIGGGVTFDNHTGIWTEGSALDLVIRAGDILEVNPGDFRTLSAVSLAGTGGALNNNTQLAFLGAFTDGSRGIFRASKVPEPAALALFALGLTGLGLIARHRRRAAYLSLHW